METLPLRTALCTLPAALMAALALAALPASAQPAGVGGPGARPSTFALADVSGAYSFSSRGDLERNGKVGSIEISRIELDASVSLPAPDSWRVSSTLSWSRDEFELNGPVPLPRDVESVGLSLTAMKDLAQEIGPGWSAIAILTPIFASDAGTVSTDNLTLRAIASLGKRVSPELAWSVGIIGRTHADHNVLPVAGVNWDFAPDWNLTVGFPRTGVSYRFSEALNITAGVTVQGGTYRITETVAAGLRNTYLDYREIRTGLGAEYQFSGNLSLTLDGGVVVDRNFDYYDRGVELDGETAGFGRLSLRYRF